MWWILGIGVVVFIIYTINKDYKEEVKTHVTNHGGMQQKYSLLVEYFTAHPASKITRLTKDNISISSSTINVSIDYVGGKTEIFIKAFLPLVGNVSKRWSYPDGYPQQKMIEEVENYLNFELSKMNKIAGNDFGQYT